MTNRPDMRYAPCRCALTNEDVWAMVAKQADGRWKIVNCLDKDQRCFQQHCAFTMDGGEWPFAEQWAGSPPSAAPKSHG